MSLVTTRTDCTVSRHFWDVAVNCSVARDRQLQKLCHQLCQLWSVLVCLPIIPQFLLARILQVRLVPKSKFLGIVVAIPISVRDARPGHQYIQASPKIISLSLHCLLTSATWRLYAPLIWATLDCVACYVHVCTHVVLCWLNALHVTQAMVQKCWRMWSTALLLEHSSSSTAPHAVVPTLMREHHYCV